MNNKSLVAVVALFLLVAFISTRPSPPSRPADEPAPQPLPRVVETPAPAPASIPTPVTPLMATPTLRVLQPYEITYAITANADHILREHHAEPLGSGYRFFVGKNLYLGRLEWSYNEPGGEKKPWGYAVGITVYKFEFP